MNCYQRAVRFHAQAFHHGPELEHLVRSKYNYIVSSQVTLHAIPSTQSIGMQCFCYHTALLEMDGQPHSAM